MGSCTDFPTTVLLAFNFSSKSPPDPVQSTRIKQICNNKRLNELIMLDVCQ